LLSGERFKESTFSWSHFQRPSCPLEFFYLPVWFTRCFNRTMTEWLTLNRRPILMDDNARPHNPYSARLSATGGNKATTLVSHVTGYESDRTFIGLSRTKSERTYPEVSKHSGIRDCFGSGVATVHSTQTETFSGTVQDAKRLHSLLTLS
jgi:hypothetical protein